MENFNNPDTFKCCLCSLEFELDHSLEAHLATTHVLYAAYECEICENALFPTDYSLREHYRRIHNLGVYNVKYKVSPELDERRNLLQRLMSESKIPTIAAVEQQLTESKSYDISSYTSKLFQTCTAHLQEQITQNAESSYPNYFTSKLLQTCTAHLQEQITQNAESDNREESSEFQIMEASTSEATNETVSAKFKKLLGSPANSFGIDFDMDSLATTPISKKTSQKSDGNTGCGRKRGRRKKMDNENGENDNNLHSVGELILVENDGTDGDKQMVECADCKRKVGKYRNSMLIHTSTHHCELPIFECLGCNKKWYSLSARTKEHIELKHGGDYSLLKDNRPELLTQLKAKTALLFPEFYSFVTKSEVLEVVGGEDV